MRTFRFTSEGTSSSDPQQQTIDCDLHLEPSANIVQEQAADCSCHTQEDCQEATQLQVQAECESAWNSGVLSGTFEDVGSFGDYAIYEKKTMDANRKWWFFHYDTTKGGWEFHYSGERVVPGFTHQRITVSTLNRPGFESSKHTVTSDWATESCDITIDGSSINNITPTDFVNLELLTARNVEFAQTTLSTGKRLLMIGENGIYQNAVDACNQFGGEVLLTVSDQENRETADFITANRNILGGEKVVWLRAKNPSPPDETPGSEWIDPLNNQVIPYHHIVQYEHQPAAFLQEGNGGYGHWKGTSESNIDPHPMCELPAV